MAVYEKLMRARHEVSRWEPRPDASAPNAREIRGLMLGLIDSLLPDAMVAEAKAASDARREEQKAADARTTAQTANGSVVIENAPPIKVDHAQAPVRIQAPASQAAPVDYGKPDVTIRSEVGPQGGDRSKVATTPPQRGAAVLPAVEPGTKPEVRDVKGKSVDGGKGKSGEGDKNKDKGGEGDKAKTEEAQS